MIWPLPHPVMGLVAGLLTLAVLSTLVGFGMGLPELLIIGTVSVAVFFLVAGRKREPLAPRR